MWNLMFDTGLRHHVMEMPFLELLLTRSYRQFNHPGAGKASFVNTSSTRTWKTIAIVYSALRLASSPNLLATIQEFTTQLLFMADTARLAPAA